MPARFRLIALPIAGLVAGLLTGHVLTADEPSPPAGTAAATEAQLAHFENHIRPLLHTRCVRCHGENQQQGGLRLDTRAAILKGGESGPAAVSGSADESLLLEAVRYESFEMPPDERLAAADIDQLQRWIADGLPWPEHNGQPVRLTGAAFTEEERSFWSLQPIGHPNPPDVPSDWARNPIDQFVLARLHAAGLTPAPPASEDVLRRRAYFALTGLPPTPEDLQGEFDLPATIDRLLADPRYGEHWARHWLDIVRYAESDGFRADGYRAHAWRYRDYVVDAFNSDKPYNVFVMEQLAGDEIAPDRGDALVATGYLRTFLYEYNQRDARTQWQDILDQVTDVTGDAFLGLSVGCARCHDHKFDPILQEDYYRLRAAFGTMLPRDDVPGVDLSERQRYQSELSQWEQRATDLRQQLAEIRQPYLERKRRAAIERFPEDIQQIMAKDAAERNPLEAQLADLVQRQVLFEQNQAKYSAADQETIARLEKQIDAEAGSPPAPLPPAFTVADVGPRAFPLHVGQMESRKAVTAGGLTILTPDVFASQPTATSSGQRTALAEWIVSPDNPLTARVIVNRIWQQHFGTGLVNTASDFGQLGGRPTHPELLDWLAGEFQRHNWSIKWLHRMILTSGTWQMSAFHPHAASAENVDPGNTLRWRFDIRRLAAEQIRDAMLSVSGELEAKVGGPSAAHDSLRRSLYLKVLRNQPEPLLRSLDGVDGLNSVPQRSTTTTPTQALNLMNGTWVRGRASAMARRILTQQVNPAANNHELAAAAFSLALGRDGSDQELAAAAQLIEDSASHHKHQVLQRRFAPLHPATGRAVRIGMAGVAPPTTKALRPAAPFTFVAIMQLESLYSTANVRTLVSAWDNQKSSHGWSIGVTSEKSAYQPRNLILQPVGKEGYEVVASNLRPALNTPTLVAVSVEEYQSAGRATFYVQALQDGAKLQTAQVDFASAEQLEGPWPLKLGGRHKSTGHNWDGFLDQAAVFDRCLSADDVRQLFADRLATESVRQQLPVALWTFDDAQDPGADTAADHRLTFDDQPVHSPREFGLSELCHVLLNCNEFVYLD